MPPEQKELDDVLADIAMDYRSVVASLEETLFLDVSELTKGTLNGEIGELWIFAKHYPELVERLGSKATLSFIEKRLKASLPNRHLLTEYGKRHFWFFDEAWNCLKDDNAELWPICVICWEMSQPLAHGSAKFAIGVQYRPLNLNEGCKASVHSALQEEFPELKKGRQNAAFRMLGKLENLSETNLAARAHGLYTRLEKALAPVVIEES